MTNSIKVILLITVVLFTSCKKDKKETEEQKPYVAGDYFIKGKIDNVPFHYKDGEDGVKVGESVNVQHQGDSTFWVFNCQIGPSNQKFSLAFLINSGTVIPNSYIKSVPESELMSYFFREKVDTLQLENYYGGKWALALVIPKSHRYQPNALTYVIEKNTVVDRGVLKISSSESENNQTNKHVYDISGILRDTELEGPNSETKLLTEVEFKFRMIAP